MKDEKGEIFNSCYFAPVFTRIKLFIELAMELKTVQPDEAFAYVAKGLKLSEENNFKKSTSDLYFTLGRLHSLKSEYAFALKAYQKSLVIAKEINDKKQIAPIYSNIGVVHEKQGRYQQAIDNHLKSIQINEALNDKSGLSTDYNNLGVVYTHQGKLDKSIEYYLKAIKIDEVLGNKGNIVGTYINIGGIYGRLGNLDKALEYFFKGVKIAESPEIYRDYKHWVANGYANIGIVYRMQENYKQSIKYFLKSKKINEELGEKRGLASIYNHIGALYVSLYSSYSAGGNTLELKNEIPKQSKSALLDTALFYQEKAYHILKEMGALRELTHSLDGFGTVLEEKNEYNKAIEAYKEMITIADSIGVREIMLNGYKRLSECYEKLNDYQNAFHYHKKILVLKDSIFSIDSNDKITEMEAKYQGEKRKHEIEVLEKEKELQSAELEKKQLLLFRRGRIISDGHFRLVAF